MHPTVYPVFINGDFTSRPVNGPCMSVSLYISFVLHSAAHTQRETVAHTQMPPSFSGARSFVWKLCSRTTCAFVAGCAGVRRQTSDNKFLQLECAASQFVSHFQTVNARANFAFLTGLDFLNDTFVSLPPPILLVVDGGCQQLTDL
jgi:hypothetical protein